MSKDRRRLIDYLAHMLEAIERINRYTEDMDELAFLRNELVQDAVVRNLDILCEASNNIQKHYPDFATRHPELPLAFAYQMRNAVAHDYFNVDYGIVWKTIYADLPVLYRKVQHAVANPD
ncbi:DUF86 domain-containing protein [Massilia forsythiae]|uniref:DUF86 domain-containing protein n=1 Tax=Massilia forsythiae TaxID=2728020 RepID=A0A7Z2VZ60_9BURK|nr:DUF86 domain-containing protein [Massilia forsythiae]QJE01799.1 DUF86 domain-containing protein [Massilia forsythiae]